MREAAVKKHSTSMRNAASQAVVNRMVICICKNYHGCTSPFYGSLLGHDMLNIYTGKRWTIISLFEDDVAVRLCVRAHVCARCVSTTMVIRIQYSFLSANQIEPPLKLNKHIQQNQDHSTHLRVVFRKGKHGNGFNNNNWITWTVTNLQHCKSILAQFLK